MDFPKPYYQQGNTTIYNADWRACGLGTRYDQFDALFADPPYGLGEAAGKNKSRTNLAVAKDYGVSDWDNAPPSESDVTWMRSLAKHQIIFGGNYFHLPPSQCWLVWDKVNSGDFADCELAWTNMDKATRLLRYMWNGMLKENPEYRCHPTQKPLSVCKWALAQFPKDIKTLVDPYMGVGTTLLAAKAAGITAVGVDINESYCESAAIRLSQECFKF